MESRILVVGILKDFLENLGRAKGLMHPTSCTEMVEEKIQRDAKPRVKRRDGISSRHITVRAPAWLQLRATSSRRGRTALVDRHIIYMHHKSQTLGATLLYPSSIPNVAKRSPAFQHSMPKVPTLKCSLDKVDN